MPRCSLPLLLPHDTVTVYFPPFAPTTPGTHRVQVSLTAAGDSVPANDVARDSLVSTSTLLTYARGLPMASSLGIYLVGFGLGSGTLLNRYEAFDTLTLTAVQASLASNPASVGRTVFGVVLDAAGHLLARTPDYVLQPADQGHFTAFPLLRPLVVPGRSAFFVGLAQPAAPAGQAPFYPLESQFVRPYNGFTPLPRRITFAIRDSSVYSAVGDSALLGLKTPRPFRSLGIFMLGVDLQATLTGLPAPTEAAPLAVYPNPARRAVTVRVPGLMGVELLDLLGRVVRVVPGADGAAQLSVNDLPVGTYVVRAHRAANQKVLFRRLAVGN